MTLPKKKYGLYGLPKWAAAPGIPQVPFGLSPMPAFTGIPFGLPPPMPAFNGIPFGLPPMPAFNGIPFGLPPMPAFTGAILPNN